MKLSVKNISLVFVAGCLGGLANAVFVWLFGAIGLTGALGVHSAPAFTPSFLYQRLVWGGLWGGLFLLPLTGLSYPVRGLLYSLGPAIVQLLVVFPYKAQQGFLGLQLGYLTPLFVLFYNAIWGVVAGGWLSLVGQEKL